MPIYEYECRKCGGRLEKLLSVPAIQFKGSGWYVTDYSSKGKAAEKSDSEPSSSGGDKKDTASEKKSDHKAKESSPAKKSSEKASSKSPSGD